MRISKPCYACGLRPVYREVREMASKRKRMARKAAGRRAPDRVWETVGDLRPVLPLKECPGAEMLAVLDAVRPNAAPASSKPKGKRGAGKSEHSGTALDFTLTDDFAYKGKVLAAAGEGVTLWYSAQFAPILNDKPGTFLYSIVYVREGKTKNRRRVNVYTIRRSPL